MDELLLPLSAASEAVLPWAPYLLAILATAAVVEASKGVWRRLLPAAHPARRRLEAWLPVLPMLLCTLWVSVADVLPVAWSDASSRLALGLLGGALSASLYQVFGDRVRALWSRVTGRVVRAVGGDGDQPPGPPGFAS